MIVVQEIVPHYRLRLFELLHQQLASAGVDLKVVYGAPNAEQAAKHDLVELPAEIGLPVRNLWLGGKVLHQPVINRLLRADLAVLPNAAKYLPNYFFWLTGRRRSPRLGFWVYHTQQRAADRSIKETISRRMMRGASWWFAYTGSTRDYLLQTGAADERITVLNNSVDVAGFRARLASVTADDLSRLSKQLGLDPKAPIGLFCGGLHRDKRLEFLFEALRCLHRQCPEFQLLVIGDGSCRHQVVQAAAQDRRIHYLGPLFGHDKAVCFRLAQLFLCPGLVGLGILDAFAAGLPLVTTDLPIHSPEIDYLQHGVNGWMTPHDPQAYADAVLDLLHAPVRRQALGQQALVDAGRHSIDAMAERYADGILRCLTSPGSV
ncbi:glycosyltransferase [Caldimonas brevitalea]|uniref:Glycosyltransferase n=1 Tax=Caldimonas brevitalea TaxID=413882 RepID=A0A0G3BWY1_9BURK|nr:glycosyltransferase [Caldimonas brevitalea]